MSAQRDPVCGMPVAETGTLSTDAGGRRHWFCSEFCLQQFLRHPAAYEKSATASRRSLSWPERHVAYFTMEIALESAIPTYSGGLGVLAGDTLRSCADLDVPVVAVTLVHRRGYLHQEIRDGHQIDSDAPWRPEDRLRAETARAAVEIEGRRVEIRAWRYDLGGSRGFIVPVLLLDTDLEENAPDDRRLTDRLYGGDERYRLAQEIVLGIGGVRMLAALGCNALRTFHLNEGHAALAPLELLRSHANSSGWDFRAVRNRTVFTTHTPVASGHDRFDWRLARRVLGDAAPPEVLEMLGGHEALDMTRLALDVSHYVNGVAMRHREVSNLLYPGYEIHQITNGVHSRTWTCDAMKGLFDKHMPGWRDDPMMLRNAIAIPDDDLWRAHENAKRELVELVATRRDRRLNRDVLTVGFARRATGYKRAELIVSDRARLRAIAHLYGLQLVFAGKAHPRDEHGKAAIATVLDAAHELEADVGIVYLEDYDLDVARTIVAGCDLWLNTPERPLEASGTSGMKAAHNGVPSLSVLDGWWREGHIEGVTGWSIGGETGSDQDDALDLYRKLEEQIVPMFYERRSAWIRVMKQAIALNASFFNTHRMVRQYIDHAYAVEDGEARAG